MKPAKFAHNNRYVEDQQYYLGRYLDNELHPLCHEPIMALNASFAYSDEPVPFKDKDKLKFKPIKIGQVWARKNFACAWFHVWGKLPKDCDRKNLYIDFSNDGEGCLFDKEGHAIKGFTAGSLIFGGFNYSSEKRYYPLDEFVDEEGNIDFYMDAASNNLLGEFVAPTKLTACGVVRRRENVLSVFYDFALLLNYARTLPFGEEKDAFIYGLKAVENAFYYYPLEEAAKRSKDLLKQLYKRPGANEINVTSVGHAHVDLAWLWPIRETKRKAQRTFASVVYLMKKYPEFHFVVSQPQQLQWMKELDPKLYEELKHFAKQGRFEPIGGGWVENDTNIPCEESLARQELYGQKFWLEEFGHYVDVRWLPDTFGYSGAIPQILKLSHQDYFMTIKISWSNRTIFPYHTFNWHGIDGTAVTVHMPPEGTYNSQADAMSLVFGQRALTEEDPKDSFMIVYGIGDGGGGPSESMVERCIREKDIPYLPKVTMERADEFFHRLKPEELPEYEGEMYLEKHRATYTSQSNNKNNNREFEGKMIAYEALLASLGEEGEKETIDLLWKEALLYQFHDILPGSSIKRVYTETDAAYKKIFTSLEGLAKKQHASFKAKEGSPLINVTGRHVKKLVKEGSSYLLYEGDGSSIPPKVFKDPKEIAPLNEIENGCFKLRMSDDGSFQTVSLEEGTLIAEEVNKLRVFRDVGDAWDFEDDYRDQPEQFMSLESQEFLDYGELLEIRQHYVFKQSKLTQTILILKDDPLIRISHDFAWKDVGYMVRSETLPCTWSPVVTSDIQYGYLNRPTTDETEHDWAQFEMCCQKWLDLSNDRYGLSVINNAKNGFMAKKGILSIDLLRSTNYPCLNAECWPVHYEYAIYPHKGGFDPIKVDTLADEFNLRPLYGELEVEVPTVDNPSVLISAWKPAYDGKGFILRMFERAGWPAEASIILPEGYQIVEECDLLEERMGDAPKGALDFHPFQIRSFRVQK